MTEKDFPTLYLVMAPTFQFPVSQLAGVADHDMDLSLVLLLVLLVLLVLLLVLLPVRFLVRLLVLRLALRLVLGLRVAARPADRDVVHGALLERASRDVIRTVRRHLGDQHGAAPKPVARLYAELQTKASVPWEHPPGSRART
ncbi:hypothetical protein ON010_g13376 [Phytophthora cinnamomi]|nr:hypothetical protein ON010_g13376 [Phytophthora cinnamomi]